MPNNGMPNARNYANALTTRLTLPVSFKTDRNGADSQLLSYVPSNRKLPHVKVTGKFETDLIQVRVKTSRPKRAHIFLTGFIADTDEKDIKNLLNSINIESLENEKLPKKIPEQEYSSSKPSKRLFIEM
ncbi:unnamed protein product [Orchesella dallaii]|uniref:39S ribosomal protein L53, mitochondrial n=1 Tax=Orchesella dallaii TaxID=48710 RepID=A0ABP1S0H0_9HEXA